MRDQKSSNRDSGLTVILTIGSGVLLGCRHVHNQIWKAGLDERKALAQLSWQMGHFGISESDTVAKIEAIYRETH